MAAEMSSTNPFVVADSDDDEAPPNPFESASSCAVEPSRTNGEAEAHIEIPLHEFTPPHMDRTVSMEGNPFYTPEDRLPEPSPSLALQATPFATPYATRDEATSTTSALDSGWTARAKGWLRHKVPSHPAGPADSAGDVEQQQQQRSKPAKAAPARTQRHWMSDNGSNLATTATSAYALNAVASERERDNARHKNWPPCRPMAHHDIDADIPASQQHMVRLGYYTWLTTATGYLWNWFTITLMFVSGSGAGFTDWFFASLFLVAGVPLSFIFWYKALYAMGEKLDGRRGQYVSTWRFVSFTFHFVFHLLMCFWMVLALPMVGGMCAGLFKMIGRFTADSAWDDVLGFFSLANVVVWFLVACASMNVLTLASKAFHGTPAA